MAGQEGQELAGVALVSVERMLGKTALTGEIFKPCGTLRHQARIGDNKQFVHIAGLDFAFKSANLEQEQLWNC
ncbi:hypothetical protein GCM10007919_25050 [Rhizobium indigoferae]|nr:hypothetical protein GCM10007919_25050 [Rhizobium indigoferae]